MGPLVARLALTGIRRRPGSALLVTLVLAGAAAVLTMALAVARVSDESWTRTFEATNGSHVEVSRIAPGGRPAGAVALPGVSASTGPWEEAITSMRVRGRDHGAHLVAGQAPGSAVARPVVTDGRWLRRGEAVLDRSFAEAIRTRPGDAIVIAGRHLRVSGIAVGTSRFPYPQAQPGTVYIASADLRAIAPDPRDRGETWALRLVRPEAVDAFVASVRSRLPGVILSTWKDSRAASAEVDQPRRIALLSLAILLMLSAVGIVGVTVGARVLERERDFAILRAVGATPRLVVVVLFTEYAALALAGAGVGLAAGQLMAPGFTARSAALLAATDTAGLAITDAMLVVACVLTVAAAAVLLPGWRAVRRPVQGALGGRRRPARLSPALGRLGLPLPVSLGAGHATARRAQAVLTVLAVSMTVITAVAALGMEATLDNQREQALDAPAPPPLRDGSDLPPPVFEGEAAEVADTQRRLRPVVYGLGGVLLAVSLLTLLVTSLLGVRERAREHAVARVIGLTPLQVLATVTTSGAVLGALAALAGIPLGLGYFVLAMELAGGGEDTALPSPASLAPLLPATMLLTTMAALPAARRAARGSLADLLRAQ